MRTLAQTYRIAVSVVRSGHTVDVFGTSRPSDHPLGRAFDTWRIDDHSVVSASTSRSLVTAYMQAAGGTGGSYNVGGPYLLAGSTTPATTPTTTTPGTAPNPHRLQSAR